MVEPMPPSSSPRGTRRVQPAAPGAAPWSTVEHPERDPLRDVPQRTTGVPRHDGPPLTPGPFWIVAAVGIGLLCLAHLIRFFAVIDDIPDEEVAAALFAVLGIIALAVGLALAGLLQRDFTVPWRIALLLGAGYFAMQATGWLAFLGAGLFN